MSKSVASPGRYPNLFNCPSGLLLPTENQDCITGEHFKQNTELTWRLRQDYIQRKVKELRDKATHPYSFSKVFNPEAGWYSVALGDLVDELIKENKFHGLEEDFPYLIDKYSEARPDLRGRRWDVSKDVAWLGSENVLTYSINTTNTSSHNSLLGPRTPEVQTLIQSTTTTVATQASVTGLQTRPRRSLKEPGRTYASVVLDSMKIASSSSSAVQVGKTISQNQPLRPAIKTGEPQKPELVARFEPSQAVIGARRQMSFQAIEKALAAGIELNERYRGGISDYNFRNANCPDHDNCAVRLSNVPPEATDKEIFDLICEGKVWSYNRCSATVNFSSDAADIAFLTRAVAKNFLERAQAPGIYLRRKRIEVTWNRNPVAPALREEQKQSRVLTIKGPADKLSCESIERQLGTYMKYLLVEKEEWFLGHRDKIVRLAFGSIRGQSRLAMKCLNLNALGNPELEGRFTVRYAFDPCASAQKDRNDKTRAKNRRIMGRA